jgi:hypothetical protein
MINPAQYSSVTEILTVALGGIIGGLVKDILVDGALQLPYKKDGYIYVGFIGGAIIGAFVGLVIDGSFITALMAGYTGTSIIQNLVTKEKKV